jgi:hypothetical protein
MFLMGDGRSSWTLALALALSHSVHARAQIAEFVAANADDARREAAVSLELAGSWPTGLADRVRADLRASLAERRLTLLDDIEGRRPAAAMILEPPDPRTAQAQITVDDLVNRRRIQRSLSVAGQPPDIWTVSLAASADELLRAAWRDIAPRVPEPEEEAAPREDGIAIPSEPVPVPPSPPPTFGVALGATFLANSLGLLAPGAELGLTYYAHPRVGVELDLGARRLLERASGLGSISGWGLDASAQARFALLPREDPWSIDVLAGVRATLVLYEGQPDAPSVSARGATDGALEASAGLRVAYAMTPTLHIGARALAGAPLRASIATAGPVDVVGVGGFSGAFKLELEWWPR